MSKKQKYYVVWHGVCPGVYSTWDDCKKQVVGITGARYKSFDTLTEAEQAFSNDYTAPTPPQPHNQATVQPTPLYIDENGLTAIRPDVANPPQLDALAVDAACSGNPGTMEYQGVYIATRQQLFHYQCPLGTNNIGEFLAIVHGLAYLKKHHLGQVIYSDSVNAINWVRMKQCRSKLPFTPDTAPLWDYIRRAEAWLNSNSYTTQILKWDTTSWGEIPADFGRK